jgi:hypothetical protein
MMTALPPALARHVGEVSVRFLILPADPDAALLHFDEEFWAWWRPEREAPFPGRVSCGHAFHPTGDAAVRHDEHTHDRWAWDIYCALYRSGAFEFALGQAATYDLQGTVIFRLIEIVGRLWAAVRLHGESLDRTEVEGPWQSVLAMKGTEGAHLGNLAQGWTAPACAASQPPTRTCPMQREDTSPNYRPAALSLVMAKGKELLYRSYRP